MCDKNKIIFIFLKTENMHISLTDWNRQLAFKLKYFVRILTHDFISNDTVLQLNPKTEDFIIINRIASDWLQIRKYTES